MNEKIKKVISYISTFILGFLAMLGLNRVRKSGSTIDIDDIRDSLSELRGIIDRAEQDNRDIADELHEARELAESVERELIASRDEAERLSGIDDRIRESYELIGESINKIRGLIEGSTKEANDIQGAGDR